jgi:intein/homing endonuclease
MNPKEEKVMVEQISREEAAWLAGIIEGEGSLMIARHKLTHDKVTFRSAISVTNTNAILIQEVSRIWFKLGCKFYYQLKKTTSGFALGIVVVGKGSTDKVLNLILPYLKTKIDLAELLREFNDEMRQCHYKRMSIEEYQKLQIKYVDRLLSLRVKTVNPQRLQRTASTVLEIG